MNHQQAIELVLHVTGLRAQEQANRALTATIWALGSCLGARQRELWSCALPAELRDVLTAAPHNRATLASQVYARVATMTGSELGQAMEHTQAVAGVLARALDASTRAQIARALPDELALLFREPTRSAGAPPQRVAHAATPRPAGTTLATGAPGSRHPLSEAQPGAAQHGSVADWDEARVDHTLGSGHPTTTHAFASEPERDRGTNHETSGMQTSVHQELEAAASLRSLGTKAAAAGVVHHGGKP